MNDFDDVEGTKKKIPTYESLQIAFSSKDAESRNYAANHIRYYYDQKGTLNPFLYPEWPASLALFRAARNGHASTVQALLDAGAKVARTYQCQQLMLDAVKNKHVDIMRMLLEARRSAPQNVHYGFDTNSTNKDCVAEDMQEAFRQVIHGDDLTVIQAMLQMHGGEATVWKDPFLLTCAVAGGKRAIVRTLLDVGADPNKAHVDQYPIVQALRASNPKDMLEMLIKAGARPELARQHGKENATLLQHTVQYGDIELIQYVMALGVDAHGDKDDISAALLKAYHVNKVQLLLDAGADPNWESSDGITPLYRAAGFASDDGIALLLRHKAQVDHVCQKGKSNWTPLMMAVWNSRTDTVRLLLEAGASRDLKDINGKTALHLAMERQQKEIVELLRNWKPSASS